MAKAKTSEKKTEKIKVLEAPLFTQGGEKAGKIKLNQEIFGVKINEALMTQAVKVYLANQRSGTASTKTRGQVSGGGAKPHRQKGLGKARAGSSRMPQWRGGGVVHGPAPKSFRLDLPKKMKRKSLLSALSAKAKDNGILVLEEVKFKEPKTKVAWKMLEKMPIKRKNMFVLGSEDTNVQKSLRNIPNLDIRTPQNLNTYEVLNEQILIFSKSILNEMEELYFKESKIGNK